ncbi:hypothetical protein SAMN04488542_1388 [Fontibacillus panacisegetis]|uniref:Uncharacterized protein n=1 Tax=Fontibacillus panacisegetis TaxID=670482 RepID=A0A1G7TLC7_9BACL|nr:hypothetical protein [Fontibacillus panacisegetis]SDG36128.1 hypothetical protein SAMN04488542_1388 [Fontibacillus panacisegetis]
MTKEEVEELYGNGTDNSSEGCEGCEIYFSYPELNISGQYSETLDRMNKDRDIDDSKSPKVKKLATFKDEYFYNYYYKGNVYIGLSPENAF